MLMLCACALGMLMLLRACGRNARISGFVCASAAGMLACQGFLFARAAGMLACQDFLFARAAGMLACQDFFGRAKALRARNWNANLCAGNKCSVLQFPFKRAAGKRHNRANDGATPSANALHFLCPWKIFWYAST